MNRRRNIVWKTPDISADGLKNFACIMMLIQTVGIAVVQNGLIHLGKYTTEQLSTVMAQDSHLMTLAGIGSVMQILGGMAVPIFAFLLVEGFLNTSKYSRYLLSLLFFAVISEIPYDLANYGHIWDVRGQNALFTMVICLLMLYFLRMIKGRPLVWQIVLNILVVLCALAWSTILRTGYGLCMILLTAVFYIGYRRNVLKTILGVLISLLYVSGPLSFYGIWCYDGTRKNRIPKYAYYLFYPMHLLALGVISLYL